MGNLSHGREAIRYYLDALKYFESDEAPKSEQLNHNIRATLYNIACAYKNIDNWTQYEKSISRIEQMVEKEKNMKELANVYQMYVDMYLRKEKPELALDYALRSLDIQRNEKTYSPRQLPYAFQYVSLVYNVGFKDYKKALEYGNECLKAAEKYGGIEEIAMAYNAIANAYFGLENYSKAEAMALRSYQLDSLSLDKNLLKTIIISNIKMGKKDKALHYFFVLENRYSEIINDEYQERLSELEVRYETEKKQLEIEKQQQIIKRQKLQQYLLIGGITVSILIVVLLWFLLRLRNRRNQALAEMNSTKDKFFTIISHDLKSPALALHQAIQLLRNNRKEWDAETLDNYCEKLLHSVDSQVNFLYDLLNWSQLQSGCTKYNPVFFDLVDEFDSDTFSLMRNMATQKGVDLQINTPQTALVNGDVNFINTVIRNLLDNAIKFTPKGGTVTLEIAHCTGVARNAPTTRISISDNGIGMTEEQRRHLIRNDATIGTGRKYSTPTRGTANETGTGLGLTVCKELLEKHGSKLYIESEEGKGSTFWFKI